MRHRKRELLTVFRIFGLGPIGLVINLHTKLEVYNFTHSRGIRAPKIIIVCHVTEKQRHWTTRRYRLHPSEFPRFGIIPECDRQTDGRTD